MLVSVCQGTDLMRQYARLAMAVDSTAGVHHGTQALSTTSALAKESTISAVRHLPDIYFQKAVALSSSASGHATA